MVWLRRDHPVFRRRRFFHGRPVEGTHDELSDIAWFTPEGEEMTQQDWQAAHAKALTVFLNGNAISEPGPRGERITDDSFLLMFNAAPRRWSSWCRWTTAGSGRSSWTPRGRTGCRRARGPKVPAGDRLTLVGPQPDGAPAARRRRVGVAREPLTRQGRPRCGPGTCSHDTVERADSGWRHVRRP